MSFADSFNLVMQYEVGPWFDPTDPAVQQGLIDTPQHRLACGYVDNSADPGGITKFGISQAANPSVDISSLTLDQAEQLYQLKYWIPSYCQSFQDPLVTIHFDTTVNMGINGAAKILQQTLGVAVDGQIGPITLGAAGKIQDLTSFTLQYLQNRLAKYQAIVNVNPSQAIFLSGWTNRINALTSWVNSQ